MKNCEHEHEDEFDYNAALERMDIYRSSGIDVAQKMTVYGEVQVQALVSIIKSLRHIASHLCDNAGESTSATTEEDTNPAWLTGVAPRS